MALQFGMPGGVELLVVALMGLIVFGLPVLLVLVVGTLWLRSSGDDYDERIRQLETEIARLQAEVGSGGGTAGGSTGADAGTDDPTDGGGSGDSVTDGNEN